MSRKILGYPSACAICGEPVVLTDRSARYLARKRGYAYCPPPKGCGAVGREANISARWTDPAERARQSAAITVHGHTLEGGWRSPTYATWQHMLQRCTNSTGPRWKYYGGRGIAVCERWRDFKNFLADMGERPAGKSIDRFPDNDGNYEPGNCRWATPKEQAWNRRRDRRTAGQAALERETQGGADGPLRSGL